MCALKSTSVVCINPSDAYNYLANSYRPYQLRNNKLAATFDGAHGQAAQVQMGMAALQNGMAENASPLTVAGRVVARSGTKTSEPAGGRRAESPRTRSTPGPVENMTSKPLCTITF